MDSRVEKLEEWMGYLWEVPSGFSTCIAELGMARDDDQSISRVAHSCLGFRGGTQWCSGIVRPVDLESTKLSSNVNFVTNEDSLPAIADDADRPRLKIKRLQSSRGPLNW